MAMTTRARLDCHALKISLQLLPVGIPAQHLGVIVSAVCGNGTINYSFSLFQTAFSPFRPPKSAVSVYPASSMALQAVS